MFHLNWGSSQLHVFGDVVDISSAKTLCSIRSNVNMPSTESVWNGRDVLDNAKRARGWGMFTMTS
jgi:hypothetical protein